MDITQLLEAIALPSGRIMTTADSSSESQRWSSPAYGVLDVTEEVVDEAVAKGCNLIVSHHPIVFRPLRSLTGRNKVERTSGRPAGGVGLYAPTPTSTVAHGVSAMMAASRSTISPCSAGESTLAKVVTYVPTGDLEAVRDAMFDAGAGNIETTTSAASLRRGGSFRAPGGADPHVGRARATSRRRPMEVVVERWNVGAS